MNSFEKSCYLLPWQEVSQIISAETEKYLEGTVPCTAKYEDETFWCIDTPGYSMPIHIACRLMQLSGFPADNWQDTLPDEGGPTVDGYGMELSGHLLHKGLGLTWRHQIITPEGLWLVDIADKVEQQPEPAIIDGIEVRFEELKSKDELFNFLGEGSCTHASLMEFCEDYKKKYGNDLCWPYPIMGDLWLGEYLILVREGVLSLPYTGFEDNDNAVLELDAAALLRPEHLMQLVTDWQSFSSDLIHAMTDMGEYLRKKEGNSK